MLRPLYLRFARRSSTESRRSRRKASGVTLASSPAAHSTVESKKPNQNQHLSDEDDEGEEVNGAYRLEHMGGPAVAKPTPHDLECGAAVAVVVDDPSRPSSRGSATSPPRDSAEDRASVSASSQVALAGPSRTSYTGSVPRDGRLGNSE
jgi:hypothetical protein